MKRYFVSFSHGSGFGFGATEFNISHGVQSMNDITGIKEQIEKDSKFRNVVVLNWQRFEN